MNGVTRIYQRIDTIYGRFGMKPSPEAAAAELGSETPAAAASPAEADFAAVLTEAGNKNAVEVPTEQRIMNAVQKAARANGIAPEIIQAVIKHESGGNPQARSPVGAMGLMQLMPGTAGELGVSDPYDIEENVAGGSRYLSSMITRFGDLKLALAAYNAGPGAVERFGGMPPYSETQNYVAKIMGDLERQG